jgi:Uma2 family endonuclease
MATATVDVRRWTREEYERLVEQGFFDPEEHIELVDGVIFEMTPQSSGHALGVSLIHLALQPLYADGYYIRIQMPLALGFDSEPEPDIAVVLGHPRDYRGGHPTSAELIVEVADSSLLHDRQRKASLYARAGIREYWILNLVEECLEVHRGPKDGVYTSKVILHGGDSISPLSQPGESMRVGTLLP